MVENFAWHPCFYRSAAPARFYQPYRLMQLFIKRSSKKITGSTKCMHTLRRTHFPFTTYFLLRIRSGIFLNMEKADFRMLSVIDFFLVIIKMPIGTKLHIGLART